MISKGTQYLTAAGFGNIRVTAASMGPLDILGTCWLRDATMQAILVAFGADGAAVIRATNAYLNGIAATDQSKAQALAGFINEDPMMVCSLGLSVEGVTMPIRFLKGDGYSWIDTEIKPTNKTRLYIPKAYWGDDTQWTSYSTDAGISYTDNGSTGNNGFGFNLWGQGLYIGFGNYTSPGSVEKNVMYSFDMNKGAWRVTRSNGADWSGTMSGNPQPTTTLALFGWRRSGNTPYLSRMYKNEAYIYTDDVLTKHFVPCTNKNGMVDLVNMVFHPNQGSGTFGEAYTRNGQPWTPPTP